MTRVLESSAGILTARTVLVWALWLAVVLGLGQALLVMVVRELTGRLILVSPDVVWMAPLANAVVFVTAAAILLVFTSKMNERRRATIVLSGLLFLFLLGPVLMTPRLNPYASLLLAAGIAVQGGRLLSSRLSFLQRWAQRTLPWLVAGCIVIAAGGHLLRQYAAASTERSLPAPAEGAPNVILIVLDTVRARSLSLHGYNRETSAALQRIGERGVVFEGAISTSPWTLPSHASMFTGRLPSEINANWLTPLDKTYPTLAEVFQSKGYATAGFVANLLYTTAETGLGRGFLTYRDFPLSGGMIVRDSWLSRALFRPLRGFFGETDRLVSKSSADINAEFAAWAATRSDRPFFVFLNYFDAHAPYLPPPPFDTRFGPGGPQPDATVRRTWSREQIQQSINAYDGAVAYVDHEIGRLSEFLESEGLMENTLIVITSDHGEQFGEHGLFDHANSLYRPVLHVPLVVTFPGKVPEGLRISHPVSLVNLPATILDLAGIGNSPLPGRSLANDWANPKLAHPEAIHFSVSQSINMPEWLPASKGDMQGVIFDGMHYIRNGDGREELYDFINDPEELQDLASDPRYVAVIEAARRALKGASIKHVD
jgi:arylsulfatase A-like enzyme